MKMLLGASLILALMLISSCGLLSEKVKITDPKVQSLLVAADAFDREFYGFSPIPTAGYVTISEPSQFPALGISPSYDIQLRFSTEKTYRGITFKRLENGYVWIGEEEIFYGPNKYTTVDGTIREMIVFQYHIESSTGYGMNSMSITYWGEDPRLDSVHFNNLELKFVQPILKEWGH
ncbi:hypothetical protein IH799_07325 [candidate division KSB1 bacterium]|nr:hypothetical protein [candidate division KSB1 bacterium]